MGIEIIGVVIFAWLLQASHFLMENALLLFLTSAVLILWMTGIVTLMRRWEGR